MNKGHIDDVRRIRLDLLVEDPEQPRKVMRGLDALVESLRKIGQTTPILVCRTEDPETFMVVDGWRRCTAAKQLKWEDIACVMSGMDRADVQFCAEFNHLSLNPFERADELFRFKQRHGWTDDQMASILGQSRSQVTSILRLRTLPEPIRAMLLPVCSEVATESLLQVARAKNAQETRRLAEMILQGRGSKDLRGERTAPKEKLGKAKQKSSPSGSHDANNNFDVSPKADVRRDERTSGEKMCRPTSPRKRRHAGR